MTASTRPYLRPGVLISRIANPVLRHLGIVPRLVVRGRKSGHWITVPMGRPLEFEGRRYLVSGRGNTHWVRNLRAAGRAEFRYQGATQPFRAIEVTGQDRERIVGAYRKALGHSVEPYFREIPDAADHPVFRMDAIGQTRPDRDASAR
jgi:hypothetical protein